MERESPEAKAIVVAVSEFSAYVNGIAAFDKRRIEDLKFNLAELFPLRIFERKQFDAVDLLYKRLVLLSDDHADLARRIQEYRDFQNWSYDFYRNENLTVNAWTVVRALCGLAKKMGDKLIDLNPNAATATSVAPEGADDEESRFDNELQTLIRSLQGGTFSISRSILLRGESGSGKSRLAVSLYEAYKRSHPIFEGGCQVKENLEIWSGADSKRGDEDAYGDMFGWDKGSWTGADAEKEGLFDAANHGGLFIDEVAELTSSIQTGFLLPLQPVKNPDGENLPRVRPYRRKGGSPHYSRFLLILATDRDLEDLVAKGDFNKALYNRITEGKTLVIPPLRKRPRFIKDAIPCILKEANQDLPGKPDVAFESNAEKCFVEYALCQEWKDNLRGLERVVADLVTGALSAGKRYIDGEVLKVVLGEPAARKFFTNLKPIAGEERSASSGPIAKYSSAEFTAAGSERILNALKIRLRAHSRRDVQYIRIMSFFVAALARDGSAIQKDVAMSIRKEIDQRTPVEAIQWSDERFRKFEDESGDPLNWGRLKALVAANADTIKSLLDKGDAWIG